MKGKKRIALLTVLIMIINLFAPYSILLKNTVSAATGTLEEKPVLLSNRGIELKNSVRVLCVQLGVATEEIFNGLDIVLKFDASKITPCDKASGATTAIKTKIGNITEQSSYFEADIFQKNYDKTAGTFLYTIAIQGGLDVVGEGYVPGEVDDPEIDEAGQGYPGYVPIIRMYFKVLDDSLTEETLPLDLFSLQPSGLDVPTGAKVSYKNASGANVSKDITELAGNGFAEAEKTIQSISVKQNPDKVDYEQGEAIDLSRRSN